MTKAEKETTIEPTIEKLRTLGFIEATLPDKKHIAKNVDQRIETLLEQNELPKVYLLALQKLPPEQRRIGLQQLMRIYLYLRSKQTNPKKAKVWMQKGRLPTGTRNNLTSMMQLQVAAKKIIDVDTKAATQREKLSDAEGILKSKARDKAAIRKAESAEYKINSLGKSSIASQSAFLNLLDIIQTSLGGERF